MLTLQNNIQNHHAFGFLFVFPLSLDVLSPSLVDSISGASAVSQRDLPQQAKNRLQTFRLGWLRHIQSFVATGTSHDSLLIYQFTLWLKPQTHIPPFCASGADLGPCS